MAIKVLIVLDGSYRFEPNNGGTAGFTFTALVAALTNAGMNVSRAHRLTGGDGDTGLNNFKFQTPQLFDYDVIWMFGHEGRNAISQSGTSPDALPQPEREAIARYMNAGGGVFATGDHDSIGAVMCGQLKRIRAMRSWYGPNDPAALANAFPVPFPANFPPTTSERADTTRRGDHTDYSATAADFVFFANQSDSTPQTITPLGSPAHMILRQGSTAITVFPDHMHEGKLIAPNVPPVDDDSPLDLNLYAESYSLDGDTLDEFPSVGGARELPEVIARSVTTGYKISNDSVNCDARDINTLCVYDGRKVGVGRIVTGATFHHYIDINLLGANNPPSEIDDADYNSAEDGGFAWQHADPAVFNKIKAVFVNITTWLARPRPAISLVLERSTFSQDEVGTGHTFPGAVLVTVDGLKPNQFPGGPIDTLSPSDAQLMQWAPQITPSGDAGFSIEPKGIASDDPSLPDRAQRFTFTYQVRFPNGNAFSVPEEVRNVQVNASLASPVTAAPLTDQAWFQLVKSANPFMLDLANGNDVSWLSSDVRSFPVVAGSTKFGVTLPENATRAQARQFIRDLVNSLDNNEFTSLDMSQPGSALSPSALSTSGKRVYNFAVARVRLNGQVANANNVRLFFRIFSSQTTAALTYELDGSGLPIAGYKRTSSAAPIALPGENPATGEWLSFPFFAEARSANPATQTDPNNVKNITPSAGNEVFTFFGALLDNNLANPGDEYLPALPGGTGPKQPLATLLAGEHQCLVAQIEYNGTPIPSGARPNTSDKLSQRNLAFSTVANPGLDGSRTAMHTFQIEATPRTISATLPPDELLLEWRGAVPANSLVRLVVPGWSAAQVIELADRYYPPFRPPPAVFPPLPPQLSGWVLVGSEPAASEGPVLSAGQDELIIFISGVESDPSAPDMSPYSAYTLDRLVDPRPRGPGLSCATTHAAVQASRRRALNSSRPIRRMRGFMAAFSRSAGVL